MKLFWDVAFWISCALIVMSPFIALLWVDRQNVVTLEELKADGWDVTELSSSMLKENDL